MHGTLQKFFFVSPYRAHLDSDCNLFFKVLFSSYINRFVHLRKFITKTMFFG